MGGEPAAIREGLQEAHVAALLGREDLRRPNYKAPRRAAGRHRLLYVVVFNLMKKKLSNAFQKSYIVTLYRGEAVAMRKADKESLLSLQSTLAWP